jgi:hypothetical protein
MQYPSPNYNKTVSFIPNHQGLGLSFYRMKCLGSIIQVTVHFLNETSSPMFILCINLNQDAINRPFFVTCFRNICPTQMKDHNVCLCDLTYRYMQGKYMCHKAKLNSVFSGKQPNDIFIYIYIHTHTHTRTHTHTKALIEVVYIL